MTERHHVIRVDTPTAKAIDKSKGKLSRSEYVEMLVATVGRCSPRLDVAEVAPFKPKPAPPGGSGVVVGPVRPTPGSRLKPGPRK